MGTRVDVGNGRLLLARLSLAENHPAEAEEQARQAEEEFQLQKDSDAESRASAVLALSLAAQRKFPEAKNILKVQFAQRMRRPQAFDDWLFVRVTAGRVLAETGSPAARAKWLESALSDASRLGYLGYQLEARLALGEIQMKSGHGAEGRAQLALLAKEAQRKGFALNRPQCSSSDDSLNRVNPASWFRLCNSRSEAGQIRGLSPCRAAEIQATTEDRLRISSPASRSP